jgi:uncharacterized phage protein gp47/JayE
MANRDAELIAEWLAEVAQLTNEISRLAGILEALPPDAAEKERSARLAELSEAMRACATAGKRLAASLGSSINKQ